MRLLLYFSALISLVFSQCVNYECQWGILTTHEETVGTEIRTSKIGCILILYPGCQFGGIVIQDDDSFDKSLLAKCNERGGNIWCYSTGKEDFHNPHFELEADAIQEMRKNDNSFSCNGASGIIRSSKDQHCLRWIDLKIWIGMGFFMGIIILIVIVISITACVLSCRKKKNRSRTHAIPRQSSQYFPLRRSPVPPGAPVFPVTGGHRHRTATSKARPVAPSAGHPIPSSGNGYPIAPPADTRSHPVAPPPSGGPAGYPVAPPPQPTSTDKPQDAKKSKSIASVKPKESAAMSAPPTQPKASVVASDGKLPSAENSADE